MALTFFYVFLFALAGMWTQLQEVERRRCWTIKTVLNYTWRYMLRYVRALVVAALIGFAGYFFVAVLFGLTVLLVVLLVLCCFM